MSKFVSQFIALASTALVGAALLVGAVGPASSAAPSQVAQTARLVA